MNYKPTNNTYLLKTYLNLLNLFTYKPKPFVSI